MKLGSIPYQQRAVSMNLPLSRIRVRQEKLLTIFTVFGELQCSDLKEMGRLYYMDDPTRHMLWDFREASFDSMTSAELLELAEHAKENMGLRENGRTAHVCKSDLQFGMCRLYTTYTDLLKVPVEYSVFRTMRAAYFWLGLQQGGEKASALKSANS